MKPRLTIAISLLLTTPAVLAQNYPSRPVRVVVAYPAGGPVDITARTLVPKLTEALGQPVVVDNRGGAGGIVGTELVAKSAPDGYTLLICTTANAINASLIPKLPYDIQKDFSAVALLVIITSVVVVNPTLPLHSIKELIAYAKERPGKLSYASTGNGTPTHLAAELFKTMTGVDMVHVPYKGAAPAVVDLISGQAQLSFISAPGVVPHLKSGRLRAIAVTNAKRSALLPELPTVSESGVPGFESEGWHGLFAPARTPKPVIDRLYREFSTALRAPDIAAYLLSAGAEPVGLPPEQMALKLREEIARWAKVVKAANMKVD